MKKKTNLPNTLDEYLLKSGIQEMGKIKDSEITLEIKCEQIGTTIKYGYARINGILFKRSKV